MAVMEKENKMGFGALVKLYDALAEKNRPKFEKMPLGQLVEFMWKRMK